MDKRILEILAGKRVSYILPFFWQQGESEAVLREYMGAIHSANILEVCVESRPHPDFGGPGWWRDMDIIMDEARRRGMRVWLLDDAHFPTGYANGAFKTADPAVCLQYLNFNLVDITGPTPHVTIDVEKMSHEPAADGPALSGAWAAGLEKRLFTDDQRLAVIACRIAEGDTLGDCLDLTGMVKDGRIIWDVPAGYWRVYVAYLTHNAGLTNNYFNIIDRDSVRVLVDAVYEPQYARYRQDFGRTFAGFYSDEPCFHNMPGFGSDCRIGRAEMPLPWNRQVPEMLRARLGEAWLTRLPLLWNAGEDRDLTARVRYAYMDVVTRLVRDNFSNQLGTWCAEHGVAYVGHIIEDNNSSSAMGSALGHYFRALDGQHMAGIDEVIWQIMFAGENARHRGNRSVQADGTFYHFVLGKLASSHAHIDPKKQGRALCEIWGASGWSLGVRGMLYSASHLMVRGVNRFTPHAFNPDAFPSPDGPPHFYAHGNNPQYRHFGALCGYMQRVCHLIDGGRHVAPAAVLYTAEADWTGCCMYEQFPARKLTESQIDFDIIPCDVLAAGQHALSDKLEINGERYSALIVPEAEYLPDTLARFTREAQRSGFPVLFIGSKPRACSDNPAPGSEFAGEVVMLERMVPRLRELGVGEIRVSPEFRQLVYYHYRRETDLYLFMNEAAGALFDGWVSVPQEGPACQYDPWENVLRPLETEATAGGTRLHLVLAPRELTAVVFGTASYPLVPRRTVSRQSMELRGWRVSMAEAKAYPEFTPAYDADTLTSFADRYPDFSGFILYETEFDGANGSVLELTDAYEGVDVWCNGIYCGMRIVPPFVFDLQSAVRPGRNYLRIEVATTLDRKVRSLGGYNRYWPNQPALESTGIVGEVRLSQ